MNRSCDSLQFLRDNIIRSDVNKYQLHCWKSHLTFAAATDLSQTIDMRCINKLSDDDEGSGGGIFCERKKKHFNDDGRQMSISIASPRLLVPLTRAQKELLQLHTKIERLLNLPKLESHSQWTQMCLVCVSSAAGIGTVTAFHFIPNRIASNVCKFRRTGRNVYCRRQFIRHNIKTESFVIGFDMIAYCEPRGTANCIKSSGVRPQEVMWTMFRGRIYRDQFLSILSRD